MTDDATTARLLRHAATALAAPSRPPTAAAVLRSADARRDRRRAVTIAGIAAVVAVSFIALDLAGSSGPDTLGPVQQPTAPAESLAPRPPYSGQGPELGQAPAPLPVVESDRIAAGGAEAAPEAQDLLAQADVGVAVAGLFGIRKEGRLCAVAARKRPAFSQWMSTHCAPSGQPPLARSPMEVGGDSPGPDASASESPAVTYGGAPAGTRYVRLEREGHTLIVHAYSGGDAYSHRAYFLAAWDLAGGPGPTVVTALTGSGATLASVTAEPTAPSPRAH